MIRGKGGRGEKEITMPIQIHATGLLFFLGAAQIKKIQGKIGSKVKDLQAITLQELVFGSGNGYTAEPVDLHLPCVFDGGN